MKHFIFYFLLLSQLLLAQDKLFIDTDYIPHTDTTLVFLPQNYDSTIQYPLLFMLHGWSGNYSQWNSIIDLKYYADELDFIIVCPDGFYDSWYLNSTMVDNSQFEKFFFEDLVPELFSRYNISEDNIFITGLSMGGHGAVTLLIKYPEFFKSAGSTSGILDLTKFPDKWGMENVMGSYNEYPENWEMNSALQLLNNSGGVKNKMIIDCGTEDFAYGVNQSFYEACKNNGTDINFISQPGNHSRKYWSDSIKDHFIFFKELCID